MTRFEYMVTVEANPVTQSIEDGDTAFQIYLHTRRNVPKALRDSVQLLRREVGDWEATAIEEAEEAE